MLRLVEALDRISITSSLLDSPTSPRGPPTLTREDSHFRIHIQIPSTTSTSSLGPVTPPDEEFMPLSLKPSATVPKILNFAGLDDCVVYKPVDRKRPVLDQTCSGVKSSPPYI